MSGSCLSREQPLQSSSVMPVCASCGSLRSVAHFEQSRWLSDFGSAGSCEACGSESEVQQTVS